MEEHICSQLPEGQWVKPQRMPDNAIVIGLHSAPPLLQVIVAIGANYLLDAVFIESWVVNARRTSPGKLPLGQLAPPEVASRFPSRT